MTFSEFAQMMYPIIGNGDNITDYIPDLIKQIMMPPSTEQEKKLDAENNYYPLLTNEFSLLTKMYNGKRTLSRKVAGQITSHLSKEKFNAYLKKYPPDVINRIGELLYKNEIEIINDDIPATCTELFASILYQCASKKTFRDKRTEIEKLLGIPKACTLSQDEFIYLQQQTLNRQLRLFNSRKKNGKNE